MKYSVNKLLTKNNGNWEGILITDQNGKQWLTNGVFKWEVTKNKLDSCKEVHSIDMTKLLGRYNKYISEYDTIEF
ncbi:hypothetical protein [Clostridium sp. ZBS18]|uniref:hypothetical protein n=1 Tax=Clostridium sp. ZBS18 TaxID=2949967 RepID=UPI00207ABCB9|nr:hypothetical protein [Clostridium sp. ZBS18]